MIEVHAEDHVFTQATVVPAGAVMGDKPAGPAGTTLGSFGSLRRASPEAVADTVVGQNLGDEAPEPLARERFRWVRAVSALDRATLGAAVADFVDGTRLVRVVVVDGQRRWRRTSLHVDPPRDFGRGPELVRELPLHENPASERLADAQRADLHHALDERLRYWNLIA
jgi:hypothetical protein